MLDTIHGIEARYGISDIRHIRPGQLYLRCAKEHAVDLLGYLRDRAGYRHLVFLTAVDVIEHGRFRLIYMLHNYEEQSDIGVEVEIARDDAEMDSIHRMWAQAATYQRELREMFGITFPGSPRLEEPFVLEGWDELPPMRRDFDTKRYSEATYFPRPGRHSYDPKEYMQQKLYPEEEA